MERKILVVLLLVFVGTLGYLFRGETHLEGNKFDNYKIAGGGKTHVRQREPLEKSSQAKDIVIKTQSATRTIKPVATEIEAVKTPVEVKEPEQKEVEMVEEERQKEQTAEELFFAETMAQLEEMRSLPGAAELIDEIKGELKKNPKAISFRHFDSEEDESFSMDDDFINKMIPDPKLRAKWEKLMALLVEKAYQGDPRDGASSEEE